MSSLLRSAGEALAQQVLALLGAPAARFLGSPEEVGQIRVVLPLRVLDVGLESQDVAQALLDEPDDVVVLVLGACDLASFVCHCSSSVRGSLSPRSLFTRPPGSQSRRAARSGP